MAATATAMTAIFIALLLGYVLSSAACDRDGRGARFIRSRNEMRAKCVPIGRNTQASMAFMLIMKTPEIRVDGNEDYTVTSAMPVITKQMLFHAPGIAPGKYTVLSAVSPGELRGARRIFARRQCAQGNERVRLIGS
jgi:hypothetical protein